MQKLFERYLYANWRPPECQFYKTEKGCNAGDKCLFPHYKFDEQPNKKPKKGYYSHKNKSKRRQECSGYCENWITIGLRLSRLGSIGFSKWKTVSGKPDAKSLGTNPKNTIHEVYAASSEYPRKERTIVWKIQVKNPHQQSPSAMKFEDQSQEETERQERCAQSRAWNLAKNIFRLKENDKATFFSPAEKCVLPVASTKEPEKRESVVDSGASMHLVSKKDLNFAKLENMRTSRSPTTVMTANGEVRTKEEATVHVKELDLFVKVMLPEETPAVLCFVKLCEVHVYTFHWISGQKPHLFRNGKRIDCNISNDVPFVVLGKTASSSSTTPSSASSPSSSQDSVFDVNRYTENSVQERSGSVGEELR